APSLYKGFSRAANLFFRLLGDRHPDFFNGSRQLSRSMCREFNLRNKDDPRVYYQSYAAKMKNSFSDILFFLTYTFVKILEGDNDGLVAVKSAQYAHFRGTIAGRGLRGVSHADLVDLRRMNSRSFDIIGVYIDIISDLRARGY
ncbi:MAG: hypothetical protein JW881_00595, partial [Spirochaetales bacterium]|nr:hypothetical protein [Spirochaetales bacterium]